jgi:hypothetical protein
MIVGSSTGRLLFGGYAVISLNDLNLPNSARIAGNAASNGNISVVNNGEICGNATYGPGKQFTTENLGHLCPGFTSEAASQPFVLNPVDQGDAATANNNAFIGAQDTWTRPDRISWDPTTRALRLQNGATLTLTGNVYSFCSLEIDNNSELQISPRSTPLKIYMDAPENCPGVSNAGSAILRNGGAIRNLNSDPATVQFYMMGSSTSETKLDYDNNFQTTVNMLIYAPQSSVSFENYTSITGAVAAKKVSLENNTSVIWHESADDVTIDGLLPLFRRQAWVECTTNVTGTAPDAGCSQ